MKYPGMRHGRLRPFVSLLGSLDPDLDLQSLDLWSALYSVEMLERSCAVGSNAPALGL
jgi:hypothetical protein